MLTWQHMFCLSLLILTVVLFALITAILDLADKLSICRCCFHCTVNVCVCVWLRHAVHARPITMEIRLAWQVALQPTQLTSSISWWADKTRGATTCAQTRAREAMTPCLQLHMRGVERIASPSISLNYPTWCFSGFLLRKRLFFQL